MTVMVSEASFLSRAAAGNYSTKPFPVFMEQNTNPLSNRNVDTIGPVQKMIIRIIYAEYNETHW